MKRLLLAVLLLLVIAPTPAQAQAPTAQGWWSVLNQGLVQPPVPPDVGPDDLLVQGGDVVAELPAAVQGDPLRQPQPIAVAALTFAVDPESTVTSLELAVKGFAIANDVRAFAAAKPFVPVQNGPQSLAPDVVLGGEVKGLLSPDNTKVAFPEIARLVRADGVLSIVLIAGIADRVVFAKPGPTALSVTPGRTPPSTLPEFPSGPPPVVSPPVTAPAFSPMPPLPAQVPPVTTTPQLPVPQAAVPGRTTRAAATTNDATTRLLVLIEALLVGVYFGLLGVGPFARLSRWTGLTTTPRGADAVRGIGRFSAVRSGPAPRL
jgi:hypothetical protein